MTAQSLSASGSSGQGDRRPSDRTASPRPALPATWRCVPVGPDKKPLIRGWPTAATADREVWREWLRRWPKAALALLTGPESGTLALDIDAPTGGRPDGFAALAELERRYGPLPPTATASSPSGGEHRFFRWPAGVARIPSRPLRPGVDVKGSSGLVTLPCGRRTPGRRWLAHPGEIGLAELPRSWLTALLPPPPPPPPRRFEHRRHDGRYLEAALARGFDRVASAAIGTRNSVLNATAWALARLDVPADAIRDVLVSAAVVAGLGRAESEATVRSALRARRRGAM
jgi:hypothetical protein